jgi:hypothetical protein
MRAMSCGRFCRNSIRTIESGQDPTGLLREVRMVVAKHADSLRLALKRPSGSRKARNADSWRAGGLWTIL